MTFFKVPSKLKAQSSNVSFHCHVAKETFELLALSFERAFENVIQRGIGCTSHTLCATIVFEGSGLESDKQNLALHTRKRPPFLFYVWNPSLDRNGS